MLTVVHDENESNEHAPAAVGGSMLDELAREGARRMLAAALQAEVAAYIEQFADELDADGRRLVVRNGYHQPREVATAAGAVPVRAPRVNDKRVDEATGERRRFSSAILPAWARKSPQVADVLPLLYLHGLSSGDFVAALEQFCGSAAGLSAATITRLTRQWQDEARAFHDRSLAGVDYVYLWVDGIHLKVRLEADKVCLLVMIGVRADGSKELVALADGYRESAESWADLLRDCKRRGMQAPVLAVGDGALGFWKALHDVFPQTREQRCWFHKLGNVLAALPKSAHPNAKKALAEIYNAEDKDHANAAAKAFAAEYGAKWPKAAAKITDDLDMLPHPLRLPGRALGPPADHEPDRVDVRDRPATSTRHQGPRLESRWHSDGVQAHRSRPGPVAHGERTPPGRARPRRRPLHQRQTGQTTRPIGHPTERRLNADPQDLTIPRHPWCELMLDTLTDDRAPWRSA